MVSHQPFVETAPPSSSRYESAQTDDGRYQLLVESITDYAIYMLSPAGIVSSWNAGAERFKGYKRDEIIGRHFSVFYTPEDVEAGLPAVALKIAASEGKFESEGWRQRKDGTRFWAYVIIDPILTPSGELVGFAKITRDLTERKAAEKVLRANQEQFRLLVNGVTDYAIYMISPAGVITSWNAGAQRIKGYTPEEVIGTHFSRFYTPEDRAADEPARAIGTARVEGRYEKEGKRVRKDGSVFWANVVIDPVYSEDGTLFGFAKITRDITAQRDARIALEKARETLFHAQKMDAIGSLTGGVAHDFNNLLMVILGSMEILRKRVSGDPRSMSLVDNAMAGAKRGSALTQRMLAFARRQDLLVEPVDIPALIANMSDLIGRSLGVDVALERRFASKLPAVLTDANQLELALLNLVVNARDALPNGGSIIIAAQEFEIPEGNQTSMVAGHYVSLTVTDNGEGMDQGTLARATEPFFTTKGVGKGTGLGLAMVYGLAEQTGGRLLLKSEIGRGTTAELWLPCSTAESTSRAKVIEHVLPVVGRSLLVLVVDDDHLVLRSTAAMLEDLGHRALEASSAFEALTLYEANSGIDLVITDHSMPKMSGVQLAEILKKRSARLPIVIATAYAELPEGMPHEIFRLFKPFTQRELETAVNMSVKNLP